MFHLGAFTVLLGTTANTDIAALSDDILTIQNGHFLPQRELDIIYAMAMSATLNRARITTPKIRQVSPIFIRPIEPAAIPGNRPGVAIWDRDAYHLAALEELEIDATSDIAMGTERFTALVALQAGGVEPIPDGNVYVMRGTSTNAATANVWTTLTTVTWADQLPVGLYGVVGSSVFSTNAIAHRWIFEDQYWRPGFPSINVIGNQPAWQFSTRRFGILGRFRQTRMPILQVLANGADASHVAHLEFVRLG